MGTHTFSPASFLKAEVLSGMSAIAPHFPDISAKILGWDLPNHVPVRWRHARGQNPALLEKAHPWLEFEADERSGRTPAQYQKVGIMTVHKGIADLYLQEFDAEQAVAYVDGGAVMVGTAHENELFSVSPDDAQRYAVGMGIGRGMLRASMGYRLPDGLFVPLTDRLSYGGVHDPATVKVTIA